MRQARPREHAAGRPRAGACRGPRGQAGAGRGALSSPVMGWTLQAAGGTREGEASAARCPSGEPFGELRRRRVVSTRRQAGWTVSGMPTGWTVFEIPSTPRPPLSVRWEMCGPDHRLRDKGAIVIAWPGLRRARKLDGGVPVGLVERWSRGDARGSRRSRRRAWSPAGGGRRLVAGQAAASWCGPGPLAFSRHVLRRAAMPKPMRRHALSTSFRTSGRRDGGAATQLEGSASRTRSCSIAVDPVQYNSEAGRSVV
ncbi:hypothetical protein PVAP13_8NG323304 [Panicum virgatum]|uniref:Uncharacterized protein n=1 Tax=Panicum virgatum TaxID=38727 RepID=A0A8T0PA29_PANVG|nr:hypothetical protein PVAP13_8NG323304 [Panicum virgatum]